MSRSLLMMTILTSTLSPLLKNMKGVGQARTSGAFEPGKQEKRNEEQHLPPESSIGIDTKMEIPTHSSHTIGSDKAAWYKMYTMCMLQVLRLLKNVRFVFSFFNLLSISQFYFLLLYFFVRTLFPALLCVCACRLVPCAGCTICYTSRTPVCSFRNSS